MKPIFLVLRATLCAVLLLGGLCLASCGHTHAFENYEVTKAPTCTVAGERTGTCACGETDVKPVAATGHGQTTQRISADADCVNDGTLSNICTVCEATVSTVPIPAKGHTGVREVVKEATCKAVGREQTVCTVCEVTYNTTVIPKVEHDALPYRYNGDATALVDGTATATCPHCDYTDTVTLVGSSTLIAEAFAGKKISILGDSISTYSGITDGAAADTTNSTIRHNLVWNGYYAGNAAFGGSSVDSTWWQTTINALGADRLVNNSHSGGSVFNRALSRCTQLHDNTGDNAGQTPDIIFVYLGTNDNSRTMGNAASLSMSQIKQLGDNASYSPTSLAEGYAVMLYRIQKAYPDAEIFCLTTLERSDNPVEQTHAVSQVIRDVVALFDGVHLADIGALTGITRDNPDYESYIPKDGGNKSIHPGVNGMREIARVLLASIAENSKYMPDGFDALLPQNQK